MTCRQFLAWFGVSALHLHAECHCFAECSVTFSISCSNWSLFPCKLIFLNFIYCHLWPMLFTQTFTASHLMPPLIFTQRKGLQNHRMFEWMVYVCPGHANSIHSNWLRWPNHNQPTWSFLSSSHRIFKSQIA